ncbi:hypothetical protein [Immundisolibacter sp.]
MNLAERLWIGTGLSVDDFCARIEHECTLLGYGDPSATTNALREFLQTLEPAAVDKRQVH